MMQEIIVMTTGGTIAKTYDEFDGSLDNRGLEVKELLESRLRLPYLNLKVFSVMDKDSLHMTDYDRTLIVKTIETHLPKKSPMVLLHGTDTMTKTAEFVFNNLKENLTHPIIFTGAMRPLGLEGSDALQNVTESLLATQILEPGIYVVFHNKVFNVPNVRKNRELRTFEKIND